MNIPLSFTIKTARLKLRAPSAEDFPHIFSATRYEGFNDGMLWDPPKDMDELIAPLENGLKAWKKGNAFGFSIEEKESGIFLGRISIRKTKEADTWNIGFWTHPIHQKKGIMTEACQAVLDFGFNQLAAKKIEAAHALWNKGSEKVLKNNGMKFVRYMEHGFQKKGKWVDENLLAIELSEYKKSH